MLHIPKIDDYLKVLTDDEVKVFVAKNFSKYFKSTEEKLCYELNKKRNPKKIAKLLYLFLKTPHEVQSNISHNCMCHYDV